MNNLVLAIDPGNRESAYCVIDKETLKPMQFGKVKNSELERMMLAYMRWGWELVYSEMVIERVASYGMAVGKEVFQTCEWTGRFVEIALLSQVSVSYVYRKDEKMHICGDSRAKDANIRRALIDRFATHDLKNGKGTKQDPDFFYQFKADCWAAYSTGLTYIEAGPSERENNDG